MASRIFDGDIFHRAVALVTTHGFPGAKAKAASISAEWAGSTGPEADDGLLMWERVRAAITILHCRLM